MLNSTFLCPPENASLLYRMLGHPIKGVVEGGDGEKIWKHFLNKLRLLISKLQKMLLWALNIVLLAQTKVGCVRMCEWIESKV
jgi:hypothetical protein